jgi:hypothetical protein
VVGVTLHQNGETEGERVETVEPSAEELAQYAGRYYSSELEAFYTIAVAEDKLVASHRRHGEIELSPTTVDGFAGDRWFLGSVAFERNEAGAVDTMLVSAGGRVRNLRFERQSE